MRELGLYLINFMVMSVR